ncbi:hypothetical protein NM208_g16390 [Fusarium decemcellulare]|uniref:Uncharacterized protein n=1 Tax=Fusarium decemcellulare TaxID=57161 RepID=A0ACC1RBK1_9HYPO|nr:hypothetical protein NM208_g16390 [Fusarium decemcellulare]
MAVLAGTPHVSARVRVAGEVTTEYEALDDCQIADTNDAAYSTSHCYIESKTGAEFRVEVTIAPDFPFAREHDTVAAHVYIDGGWVSSALVQKHFLHFFQQPYTMEISYAKCRTETDGPLVLKNFAFAPITRTDTTSHDKEASDAQRAKWLGTIRVKIFTAKYEGTEDWRTVPVYREKDMEFSEKAMKGRELSHGTCLTESTREPPAKASKLSDYKLLGTFIFYYRSHEALQHEMIIPRSPSPTALKPPERDPIEEGLSLLSEDEVRRLAAERLRDMQVKREPRRVKREGESTPILPVRPLKAIKLDDGTEVFDLTDD